MSFIHFLYVFIPHFLFCEWKMKSTSFVKIFGKCCPFVFFSRRCYRTAGPVSEKCYRSFWIPTGPSKSHSQINFFYLYKFHKNSFQTCQCVYMGAWMSVIAWGQAGQASMECPVPFHKPYTKIHPLFYTRIKTLSWKFNTSWYCWMLVPFLLP